MTWLLTFNKEVLALSENVSIMMASIFAISLGVGRIIAGYPAQRYSGFGVTAGCIVLAIVMVLFVLPQNRVEMGVVSAGTNRLQDVPLLAYPFLGLFISPIYPLLNSAVLTALPKNSTVLWWGSLSFFLPWAAL